MTLAPLVHPEIRGVEGKPADISPWCPVPACISRAQQRHHVFPRSYLRGQPIEWVSIKGITIPNSVGLCLRHHQMVTGDVGGHKAHIRWDESLKLLTWWQSDENGDWVPFGMLKGQPLLNPEPEVVEVRRREGLCERCGRPKRGAIKPGPKRKVKLWSISVPDDAEVGSNVLDTYIEDIGAMMGLDPAYPRLLRYHVLAPVLEWVMQNRVEFLREWEEASA